jgi:hypothetical protein
MATLDVSSVHVAVNLIKLRKRKLRDLHTVPFSFITLIRCDGLVVGSVCSVLLYGTRCN